MQEQFNLIPTAVKLAHSYWQRLVKEGDLVIDATCGNGRDTLFLAALVGEKGSLVGLDIQEKALERTRQLLEENLPQSQLKNIRLFLQSHATPPPGVDGKVKLIAYNLGYLPGGSKNLTTQTSSTLESVNNYLNLLLPRGALSIVCYPGHPEGAGEERALLEELGKLPSADWAVCVHRWLNRASAPSLILVERKN